MPLRPIDAIFVHPKDRYYVIYQDGELHRLTRMKLDFNSWTRRQPFVDNVENIYLTKSQKIDDTKLNEVLSTHHLPASLHGRDLPFFLAWWQANGYELSKSTSQNDARYDDANSASKDSDKSATSNINNTPKVPPLVAPSQTSNTHLSTLSHPPKAEQHIEPQSSPKPHHSTLNEFTDKDSVPKKTDINSVFDSLLDDLCNEVKVKSNTK